MSIFKGSESIKKYFNLRHPYDEETLSNLFLNHIEHQRIKSFRYSQKAERGTGADWLWLVLSPYGAYVFLVQAKKLKSKQITKQQAEYNKGEQMRVLLEYSERIDAFPIYVLFAEKIESFNCKEMKLNTSEGVFFEPAQRIKEFINKDKSKLRHKPISCMFSCYHKECHYRKRVYLGRIRSGMCHVCSECGLCKENLTNDCESPFERFFLAEYGLNIHRHPLDGKLFMFRYAETVLLENQKLLQYSVENFMGQESIPIQHIIVSDYIGRHDDRLTKAILGEDFEVDHDNVLKIEQVISAVKEEWRTVSDLISDIGIFGSYARLFKYREEEGEEEEGEYIYDCATEESDVDIAIKYHVTRFKSEKDIARLYGFIRGIISRLRKNIDFVDYEGASNDAEFIKDIENDMIWLDLKK